MLNFTGCIYIESVRFIIWQQRAARTKKHGSCWKVALFIGLKSTAQITTKKVILDLLPIDKAGYTNSMQFP